MLFLVLGCTSSSKDTSEPFVPLVSVDVQILDAMSGVKSGVTLTTEHSTETTDTEGKASVLVSGNQDITITAQASGYMDHHIVGSAMVDDVTMVSLIASRSTTSQVYSMLGIAVDENKGVLIVALDDPNLYPATGASADISSNHDGAFVFTATGVQQSNTVQSYGFVAFPNVDIGTTTISVTPPSGQECWLHAGGTKGDTQDVDVLADQVTVALFQCDVL
jgi:hypothetical protein